VTKGDGSTPDVDLFVVESEDLFCCDTDNGEGLVELPEVNVVLC
jgi:hypothetical protein